MKVEFKDVSFKYYSSEEYIFEHLSFIIENNGMLAILGHNGSGKSTIAKLIVGLLTPTSGKILIDDEEVNDDTIDRIRQKMGIIFQNPDNQFVGVTVKDDIAFGLENHQIPRKEMIEQIDKYAKLVDMQEYLEYNPENLSGGQKQRVAIAGALAMETELIIFDESTSMLDPKGTKEINQMIYKLKNELNKTIITITHNLEEAVIADRVIVLNNGKIVLDGNPKNVLKEKSVLEASGLKLLDCLDLIDELKNKTYNNKEKIEFSNETMIGALAKYISTENEKFQPMNANFGILPQFDEKIRDKKEKYEKLAKRALEKL